MRRWMIRTAAILVTAVLLFPLQAGAVSAQKAVLMDAATGRILYEKRGQERSLIASTTKIMTALVVCQQCNVLDRVRIPPDAVGVEGSSMYLREGEILTVQELLYGLMLSSGNDAAVALAIYCGGTVEGFAELMNDKARAIGMRDTHFSNPNGLDAPDHYSTARDLAILASYAMEDPMFAQIVSTRQIRIGERWLTNHNKLLWRLDGADGVKTGFTKAAGRILVSSATRQGRRLVCVTINAPDDWRDHEQLLEMGFSDYSLRKIVSEGDVVDTCQVLCGDLTEVELVAASDFLYALRDDEHPQIVTGGRSVVYSPVVEGSAAGAAYVMLGDKCIGSVILEYGETVEQKPLEKESIWKRWLKGE